MDLLTAPLQLQFLNYMITYLAAGSERFLKWQRLAVIWEGLWKSFGEVQS